LLQALAAQNTDASWYNMTVNELNSEAENFYPQKSFGWEAAKTISPLASS
jgi:hypothetical protein